MMFCFRIKILYLIIIFNVFGSVSLFAKRQENTVPIKSRLTRNKQVITSRLSSVNKPKTYVSNDEAEENKDIINKLRQQEIVSVGDQDYE